MRSYGTGQSSGLSFGPALTPTVRALLAANISVFVLRWLLGDGATRYSFDHFFGLVPREALDRLHLWQFVTYMFLHQNFWHLFFNMFLLWMFGSEIDSQWGKRAFLRYYLFTGIGAGLVYVLLMPRIEPATAAIPLIGASGAGYGILTAYGLLYPERRVLLWFLIPIKVKWFVIGLGIFELLATRTPSSVGHLAHLGGILFGVLYLKVGDRLWRKFTRARRRNRARGRFHVLDDAPPPASGTAPGPEPRDEIDRLLEKISREGLASLTEQERETLRRASRKN